MALKTLQDLFVGELQDVYSAEKQILEALPMMAKTASSPDLRRAFVAHHKQTEDQVARLDMIFEQLGASPRRKKCKGMEGLLAEGTEIMKEEGEQAVIDAGLIAAASVNPSLVQRWALVDPQRPSDGEVAWLVAPATAGDRARTSSWSLQ
jgi:ferritin-like metal-binding protein YciE